MTGIPARYAAHLPIIPALELCVWTIIGDWEGLLMLRKSLLISRSAVISLTGFISLTSEGRK